MQQEFILVGNALWLDFVNTKIVADGKPADLLGSFDDLAAWLSEAKIPIASHSWTAIQQRSLLGSARKFRDTLRQIAEQVYAKKEPSQSQVDQVNQVLACKWSSPRLEKAGRRFQRNYASKLEHPEQILVPIAESVLDLLCEGDLKLIKKCGNKDCILYFYDSTKNHKRRWCSMDACGNRMKVAAYWERQRRRTNRQDAMNAK